MDFISLFKNVVCKFSNHIAVRCGESILTYNQLDYMSDKLAGIIEMKYSHDKKMIGIFMERSIEYIVSILAIIKSDNAYVPIDSDTLNPGRGGFPEKRLKYMCQDSEIDLILTKTKYCMCLPDDIRKICVSDDVYAEDIAPASSANKDISSNEIMYGIYTSGSTGHPKLVLIKHESVINLFTFLWKEKFADLPEKTVVSMNAPFGFDASVQQLVCLLCGYTLDIIPEKVRMSGKNTIDYIIEHKINVLDCTPTQLKILLDENIFLQCKGVLLKLLVGGEAISNEMWKLLQMEKDIEIYNVYGPTECTVDTTIYKINDRKHNKSYPVLGKPIDNMEISIRDENMMVVAKGEEGEIYISGIGVTPGYYNRDELNSKSLVVLDSKIHYRSGDFGYFDKDDDLVFVGRRDEQVKVRSHRIELGEIRKTILNNENVIEAYVTITGKVDKKIVAFVELKKDMSVEDMRRFLQQYIPEYMLPNYISFVDMWPMTKNGKLDIESLLQKHLINGLHKNGLHKKNKVNPRSQLEEELKGMFIEVLCITEIDVDDNFFEYGGDSFGVMALLSKVYKIYNVEVDILEFFNKPTIGNLAEIIVNQGGANEEN